jgi:hypothetical protein
MAKSPSHHKACNGRRLLEPLLSDGGLENGVADENAFRMVDDRKRCQAEIQNI